MPEFHAREAEHQTWKAAVLNRDLELAPIDTSAFNPPSRAKPTLPPTGHASEGP
jgi:hypothetical protein